MRVTIKLLNVYRKYLPAEAQSSAYSLEIPIGTPIEDLLARVPVPADERNVILINGQTPQDAQILRDGDTVTIFPAMAGG